VKIISFLFLLTGGISQFFNNDKICASPFNFKMENEVNQIDSFYDQLIVNKADSILLYHELRHKHETKGLITWKSMDTLHGITFKTSLGKMYEIKGIASLENQLIAMRFLYFSKEKSLSDTLPPFP
jgi:hypothetical protein